MDKKSRIKAVSAILVLLNLNFWPEDKRENYKAICRGVLEVFEFEKKSEVERIESEVRDMSQLFLSPDFREFDQFSFINYRKNMKVLEDLNAELS